MSNNKEMTMMSIICHPCFFFNDNEEHHLSFVSQILYPQDTVPYSPGIHPRYPIQHRRRI